VERIEQHVLAAQGHQRQGGEDHDHHQQLGELQRAGNGVLQELAPPHVEEGERHDGEEGGPRKEAAGKREDLLEPKGRHLYFDALAISERNSASTLSGLGRPFALASSTQRCSSGAVRAFTSATNFASAFVTCTLF